jgi:hypothetical protein
MSRFLLLLTAFLTIAGAAEETKPPPARSVRFFPVGESPPFRQEIRDGVRYELEPPPNSIPPRQVLPLAGEKPEDAVDLRLGRISQPVKVPTGEGPYQLLPAGGKPGDKPWHQFQRPETGDFLVFFWRKPGPAGWSEVSHLVVPDGPLGNPAGTVRIVNLFPQTIRILWGPEAIVLKAGAHVSKTIQPGAETPIAVVSADAAGSAKRYFSTTVTQNPGERGWIVLHRADGEAPRRPLKVLIIREPVTL